MRCSSSYPDISVHKRPALHFSGRLCPPGPERRPAGTATPSARPWVRKLDDSYQGASIRKRAAAEAKGGRRIQTTRLKHSQRRIRTTDAQGRAREFGTSAEERSTPRRTTHTDLHALSKQDLRNHAGRRIQYRGSKFGV